MRELSLIRARWGAHAPSPMGVSRRYAVLCPLAETAEGLSLLLEVRSAGLRRQPGEVCFPGGKIESGETAVEAALRETWEELAIPPAEIQVLGRTDYLLHPNGQLLQPVLGLVSPAGLEALTPSSDEVDTAFTVPLRFLRETPPQVYHYDLDPRVQADFPYEEVGIPRDYRWGRGQVEVPVWHYGGHVIWGMTGRILQHFLRELDSMEPLPD